MIELNEHSIDFIGPIGQYQLQRLLARGGMSNIYLAYDTEAQRTVAIKLVHSDDGDYCTRFQREVKAIAQLHHDHILPAFDYGEHGEWCYLVMPYIEGGTLGRRLERGPLTQKEVSTFFLQLTNAVQFAHEHGILHRDIKPSNILLRDGDHLYLTDFGLVRHIEEDSNITSTGYIIGTPEYIAPEQVEHPATKSSDIYALGIVLYQMLTGRVPFKGSTPIGTCWKHLHEEPVPPSKLNPQISQATEAVILRALAKEPRCRYQSVREFARAYQHSLREESLSSAHTLAIPLATLHTSPRKRMSPGIIALAILLMFFIMPTSLGFVLSRTYGSLSYQAPTLLGASGSFFKGQVTGKPPAHITATSTPTVDKVSTPPPASNTPNRYMPAPMPTATPHATNPGNNHTQGGNGNGTSQGGKGNNPGHGHGGGNDSGNGNKGGNSNSHGGNKGGGDGGNDGGDDSHNSLQNSVNLS